MALQDRRFALADRFGDALAFVELDRDAAKVVVDGMIIVEGADILGDRRKRTPERGERPTVSRMGMCGGVRIGPRGMDTRMNYEGGRVDRIVALDDVALGGRSGSGFARR